MRLDFRLLVVDDNTRGIGIALSTLRDYLEMMGYELVPDVLTRCGPEEVGKLQEDGRKFDLVMVDYDLGPGTKEDGVDVVSALRGIMKYTGDGVLFGLPTEGSVQEDRGEGHPGSVRRRTRGPPRSAPRVGRDRDPQGRSI